MIIGVVAKPLDALDVVSLPLVLGQWPIVTTEATLLLIDALGDKCVDEVLLDLWPAHILDRPPKDGLLLLGHSSE